MAATLVTAGLQAQQQPVVRAERLFQRFGPTLVLRGVTAQFELGERVALLGPNGAGKTTLLRILATLQRPSSGTVRVFGLDPQSDGGTIRRSIGYVAHQALFYPQLTATENLVLSAALADVPWSDVSTAETLESVGLLPVAHRRVSFFSRGMVQRLALARALQHQPDLLLLDEPESGLDPLAVDRLETLLTEAVRRSRATVVFTSHQIEQALRLASRVLVIVGGKVVLDQNSAGLSTAQLEHLYSGAAHGF